MAGSILGNRVVRKEDPRFLTTGGVYLDDLDAAELAGAAHGVITSIESADALAMPGVLGVFTGADLELAPVASPYNPAVARPLLAIDRVRDVGEPIAAVVAEIREGPTDAIQAVVVEIDRLDVHVDPEAALTATTPLYEGAPGNAVFDSTALGLSGAHLGVRHIDMPTTPERVSHAIRAAS